MHLSVTRTESYLQFLTVLILFVFVLLLYYFSYTDTKTFFDYHNLAFRYKFTVNKYIYRFTGYLFQLNKE